MSTYREVLEEREKKLAAAIISFGESLNKIVKYLKEHWEEIKEILEDVQYVEIPKLNWHVPSKIVLKNQVSIRKPRMAVARSSC